MNHSDQINELATALNLFQTELVTVGKTAANPFYKSKYADLASIMLAAQPIVTKHGLAITQMLSTDNDKPALTTIIMHKSGQWIQSTIEMIPAKSDPQGVGSAVSYYRRYAYAAALQIVIDEDDDGNSASGKTKPPVRVARPATTAQAALPAQRTAIKNHLDKIGILPDAMSDYLMSKYSVAMPLSKEDASKVLHEMIMENSK